MNKIEWTARPSCVYNGGVECERKGSCERCGWRPDVAASRKDALRRECASAAEAARINGVLTIGGVSV